MRLLHARHAGDRARHRAAPARCGRSAHSPGAGGQSLPLHRLCRHRACHLRVCWPKPCRCRLLYSSPLPVLVVMPTLTPASPTTMPAARRGHGIRPDDAHWLAAGDGMGRHPRSGTDCRLRAGRAARFASTGDRLSGEVRASLGPIETLFIGEGIMAFDEADRRAEISGDGRDTRTGTRLSARAVLTLRALDADATAATLGDRLHICAGRWRSSAAARWCGNSPPKSPKLSRAIWRHGCAVQRRHAPRRLSVGDLMLRAIWRRLRAVIGLG